MSQSNDGRKRVRRSLPPLAEACADFKSFARGENCSERVNALLEGVIQRTRQATPQPFYAMREVAEFFGISVTTVARIYRRLEREGVLTLVRGSQSTMTPRTARPRFAVRGVVCMPIWLPGFLQFLDWRRLFSQLEEGLSRHRYVLEPIFYKADEDSRPDFVDRILKFNPDYLLWNQPTEQDERLMQSISDAGVSRLLILNTGDPYPFSGRIYWQSYQRGLEQGLREWKASREIDEIILPRHGPKVSATQVLKPVLKTCGLPHRAEAYPDTSPQADLSPLKDYLQQLVPNPRAGIIFDDDLFFTRLCTLLPDDLMKLFARRRVMVMREVTLPTLKPQPEGVTVDTLLLPGKQLARRIARDLTTGRGSLAAEEIVFEAEWRPRVPLAEVALRHSVE